MLNTCTYASLDEVHRVAGLRHGWVGGAAVSIARAGFLSRTLMHRVSVKVGYGVERELVIFTCEKAYRGSSGRNGLWYGIRS